MIPSDWMLLNNAINTPHKLERKKKTVRIERGESKAIGLSIKSSPGTCLNMAAVPTNYPGVNVDSCPGLC